VECIEIAENWNYNLGAALKYLWRAGIKTPDPTTDLKKAIWHIEREIERVSTNPSPLPPDGGRDEYAGNAKHSVAEGAWPLAENEPTMVKKDPNRAIYHEKVIWPNI